MGTGEQQWQMTSQAIFALLQTSVTTVDTFERIFLREREDLVNPVPLIIRDEDFDETIHMLNEANVQWSGQVHSYAVYKKDENGNLVYDENNNPIIEEYRDEFARTEDGKSHIIFVNGHVRPMINPETGEPVVTTKGNFKMEGGDIDKAVEIRNAVMEERIKNNLKEHLKFPTDEAYKGDYIKLEFPGFETRARVADEIRARTTINCIIPKDLDDNSLYIRKDMFERTEDGGPSLVEPILKEYLFMEQFPQYFEFLKKQDQWLKETKEIIERASTNDKGIGVIQFGRPSDLTGISEGFLKLVYIDGQTGWFCGKDFNLTNSVEKDKFFNALRLKGYTYPLHGDNLTKDDINKFLNDCQYGEEFSKNRDVLNDFLLNHKEEALNGITIEYKDGDKTADLSKDDFFTSIQIHVDNTALVGNLYLSGEDEDRQLAEMLKEAKATKIEKSITVTTVDGKSINAALAANEYVRESKDFTTVTMGHRHDNLNEEQTKQEESEIDQFDKIQKETLQDHDDRDPDIEPENLLEEELEEDLAEEEDFIPGH